MDFRQLTYFVRVVELRSFTRAAEALRISQPAVGEQIRNLEAELEVALLVRHSRGVEPTEAGRLLFEKALAILLQVEEARTAVREYDKGLRGAVTLGLSPGISDAVAAEVIARCSRDYPGVVINVIEDLSSSLIQRISNGDPLGFVVVSGFDLATTPNVAAAGLYEEALYAVGSPTVLGKTGEPIAFRDLARFRLILLGNGYRAPSGLRAELERMARRVEIVLSIAYEIHAVSVVKQLVERGIGVAILPLSAVRDRVADGRLSARRIEQPTVLRQLNLVWNAAHAPSAAEQAVKALLIGIISEAS